MAGRPGLSWAKLGWAGLGLGELNLLRINHVRSSRIEWIHGISVLGYGVRSKQTCLDYTV